MEQLEQKIYATLGEINFPETQTSLLDTDIIEKFTLNGTTARVQLQEAKDLEPFLEEIKQQIKDGLTALNEIDEVIFDSPLIQKASEEAPSYLKNYTNVILVASGKGGVGKSTVATNLALALQANNKKVSLLDADIFGPSIPAMLGQSKEQATFIGDQIQPLTSYNIEFMSIGNLLNERETAILRGPMVHQILEQILRDTIWPGGDYMIIDLPPGTGDVQISLAQLTKPTGSIIVSTPQDIALLDAKKAIAMFQKTDIPILGMIENMSSFICPHCQEETAIFGEKGVEKESKYQKVPLLGKIPLALAIREGGDSGTPFILEEKTPIQEAFLDIVKTFERTLA